MTKRLAILAGFRNRWNGHCLVLFRKEKKVSGLPIGIADGEAQERFLRQNAAFLAECAKLYALLGKMFIRSLVSARAQHQVEEIAEDLQLSEAQEITVQDRRMADVVVFYLGRAVADDLGEVLILAGNGRGIGAYKILRGMYERVVTAAFIAKNPSEARIFLSHSFVEREKLWNRLKEILPNITDERTPEQIKEFEDECREAKAKLKACDVGRCELDNISAWKTVVRLHEKSTIVSEG